MEWNSIETAPKGKRVLLLVETKHGPRRILGEFVSKFQMEMDEDWGDFDERSGAYWWPEGWYEVCWYADDIAGFRVTDPAIGWCPLPDVPV